MKFSKKKFLKNAPNGIKKQLSDQLDSLDGADVVFDGRYGTDGYIKRKMNDGLEYNLYPVYKSWCDDL